MQQQIEELFKVATENCSHCANVHVTIMSTFRRLFFNTLCSCLVQVFFSMFVIRTRDAHDIILKCYPLSYLFGHGAAYPCHFRPNNCELTSDRRVLWPNNNPLR